MPQASFVQDWYICSSDQCSLAHPTCEASICPSGTRLMLPARMCVHSTCTFTECCTEAQGADLLTCAGTGFMCASATLPKANFKSIACGPEGLCSQAECCDANPSCGSFSCPSTNSTSNAANAATLCAGPSCTMADCCSLSPTCAVYVLRPHLKSRAGAALQSSLPSTRGAGANCSFAECCDLFIAPMCGDSYCLQRWKSAQASSRTKCSDSGCSFDDC
jgi:hypothetical protein